MSNYKLDGTIDCVVVAVEFSPSKLLNNVAEKIGHIVIFFVRRGDDERSPCKLLVRNIQLENYSPLTLCEIPGVVLKFYYTRTGR